MQYEIGGLKTLAVVAAGIARGRPIPKADMGGSKQWIDFPGPAGTVTKYSFSRVLPLQVVHGVVRSPGGAGFHKRLELDRRGGDQGRSASDRQRATRCRRARSRARSS